MGVIVVSEHDSLDGVIEHPTGEDSFQRNGWFQDFGGLDVELWRKVGRP